MKSTSVANAISIPRWLYGLIGVAITAGLFHTVRLELAASEVERHETVLVNHEIDINKLQSENAAYPPIEMKADIRKLTEAVFECRKELAVLREKLSESK